MDIVTHAMIGMIGASPLLISHPLPAAAFAFGSVLPDLDAAARLAGKRPYLACHQTYTHGLPAIALTGLAVWGALSWLEEPLRHEAAGVALAVSAGMLLHSLLDWTNTLGIALLSPFRARRYCLEWVFFLDAWVIAASVVTLGLISRPFFAGRNVGWTIPLAYFALMGAYWLTKGWLRRRAGRIAPVGTQALMPSSLIPWKFLGCRKAALLSDAPGAVLFELDLWSGQIRDYAEYAIHDPRYETLLATIPEFALMRGFSPAYHVVEVLPRGTGVILKCRDLRTRHFGTTYGDLEIELDAGQNLKGVRFHV